MGLSNIKKFFAWFSVLFVFFGTVFIIPQRATAANSIENKALASSVVDCYRKGQFKTPVERSEFNGNIGTIVKSGGKTYVPTSYDGNPTSNCSSLILKLINNKGVTIPNRATPSQTVTGLMVGLGYTTNPTGSSAGKCAYFRYTDSDNNHTIATQKICASAIDPKTGVIMVDDVELQSGDTSVVQFQSAKNSSITVDCDTSFFTLGGCGTHSFVKGQTKWDDFIKEIEGDLLTNARVKTFSSSDGGYSYSLDGIHDESVTNNDSYNDANATYTLEVNGGSLTNGTRYLTGSAYDNYPTFSDGEQFVLYQNYLVNYFGAEVHCDWNDTEKAAYSGGYTKVRLYRGGGFKTCYAKATKNSGGTVGGIDDNRHFGKSCDFACVANWLDSSTVTSLPSDISEPNESTNSNAAANISGGNYGSADDLNCDSIVDNYVDGNVGAMQWILCPTMDNTRYTASWIDEMTDDWLTVPANIYGPGSPTETAWGSIRNIANILMVAFLLIIIFSQLTGYGIDNYGIKKMLPRLIVMAIIVNLSFYICVIAVDISNIAGQGLREMFGSLGPDTGVGGTNFLGGMITGIFATAGGATTAVGAGITLVSLGAPIAIAVIIAVIVLCLVILVAVVTLFLMLGVREIIVIFCILIAPLAFAAFILPNTQNMFKKWWNLFKSAIIIYPICGAVSGISYLLRSMSSNMELSMWGFAVLMILPYIGFFFIPMLLRESISALGKLGGALTSVGQTIKNGGRAIGQNAMRVAQNTEGFKNMQVEAARRRQSESSRRTINKLEALKGQRELTDPETRRLARAHEVQRKLGMENEAARTILTEKEFANRSMTDLMNAWDKAFDDGDTDRMDALTNVIVAKHGPGGVNELAKRLGDKNIFEANPGGVDNAHPDGMRFVGGDNGIMAKSFNALQANMMQNKALATNMQNKASDAFQMISGGGYYTPDGSDTAVRGNLNMHSMYNSIATQTKDWATQSSATLKRAAEAGTLSKEVARNILNSTDPAIQSGIQSDASKRMVLQAAASGRLVTARNATKEAAHEAWSGKNANGNTNIEEAARYYRNFTAGGSI